MVQKFIPENENILNQNPKLAAVLNESVEAEVALEGYHNSLIWLPFSTLCNNIKNSNIELTTVFGDKVLAGFIVNLYNKTWASLTRINESVFKNLRRCRVDEKFKIRFEKKNREVFIHNKFLFKLKVDEIEHMHFSLQLGDLFLLSHFKRLIKTKEYSNVFKEFDSHRIQYLGLLKTLRDNNFKEIKTNDLINREASFKIANSKTIKVHVNVFLDKFISDYSILRITIMEYNQTLYNNPVSTELLSMLISLMELESIEYLTSQCAIRLYHLNYGILKNEREAKLLTHFFLNTCGTAGLTSLHEFEMREQSNGAYTKLRVKEVDRILNQYS
ncbi:MAG: hypothetical protein NTW54_10475 [Bacteroidetes bacterium]|nr:hypothetical protein [Bacteroidota bacterium]